MPTVPGAMDRTWKALPTGMKRTKMDPILPPLDSSAHAFIHSDAGIRKIILEGRNAGKISAMPAFNGAVSDQQIASLMEFIKSTWPEGARTHQHSLGMAINEAWIRPAAQGDNGAVYLTIYNPTSYADVLVGVITDVAEAVQVHETIIAEDGMSHMEHMTHLPVPPNGIVVFEPGGKHLMLVNLKRELITGDSFLMKLSFQNSGDVLISVTVKE